LVGTKQEEEGPVPEAVTMRTLHEAPFVLLFLGMVVVRAQSKSKPYMTGDWPPDSRNLNPCVDGKWLHAVEY